jgi:cysteine-rich repeat protein
VQSGVESCDDGNQMNTDGCTNACQLPRCGDGFVQVGIESCDDGNAINTDTCHNDCSGNCGDGIVNGGESCDDGNAINTDTCHNDCSGNCGDGVINGGEICDDGNVMTADACVNCNLARCGDGFVRAGIEACDDGNQMNTDTCINTCELSRCGDGFIQAGGETCDDGNLINTDSCTNICQVARCGDGFIQAGEACDDGNSIDIDTCRNNCQFNGPPCGINCPFIEMILIEAGSFNMGGNNINNPQTRPIHNVQIRSNFYVGKTEVTVGQYRACVNAGQCSEPDSSGITLALLCNWTMMPGSKETHPVNCITWGQARTFAKWIGGDLLTEAQWEYVAKSKGKAMIYPWGNTDASCQLANYNECVRGSSPVCSTIGGNTEQGVCDMGGNVWDLVLDEYHNGYGGAPVNELAWCGDIGVCETNIDSTSRIIRGGGWANLLPGFLETAYRTDISPNARSSDIGFRVAKSAQVP